MLIVSLATEGGCAVGAQPETSVMVESLKSHRLELAADRPSSVTSRFSFSICIAERELLLASI